MNPWLDPSIPAQMRAKADEDMRRLEHELRGDLSHYPMLVPHFRAFAEAVRATQCPGEILEVGCGVGHGREILDRAGVEYRSYTGTDINPAAIALAKERYPESRWEEPNLVFPYKQPLEGERFDIVIDGSCVLHVDDWRDHLGHLCRASRRWVILHRVPVTRGGQATYQSATAGYGHDFPAWKFSLAEINSEMANHGFVPCHLYPADGGSETYVYAKPRHFCTYSDDAYLPRLKALYASMVKHCGPFYLHVLAWGERVYEWGGEVDHVTTHDAAKWLQGRHPDLQRANLPGPQRTPIEHYWTCGPQFIADVMKGTGEPVTYVDADVMFFSSPEPVFAEICGAPAGVVPHGFAKASQGLPGPTVESHEEHGPQKIGFGKYNVGIVHVRDKRFADMWAAMCKVWCYDRLQDSRGSQFEKTGLTNLYADQKYLEAFPGAHVVQHPGACLGPWAVHTRALDVRDGQVYFGGRKVVSYHFSGLRELPDGYSVPTRPEYQLSKRQEEILYLPYYSELEKAKR